MIRYLKIVYFILIVLCINIDNFEAIEKEVKANGIEFSKPATKHGDDSWSAEIIDPDGNVIFFNTYPSEREQYVKTGKLIDY